MSKRRSKKSKPDSIKNIKVEEISIKKKYIDVDDDSMKNINQDDITIRTKSHKGEYLPIVDKKDIKSKVRISTSDDKEDIKEEEYINIRNKKLELENGENIRIKSKDSKKYLNIKDELNSEIIEGVIEDANIIDIEASNKDCISDLITIIQTSNYKIFNLPIGLKEKDDVIEKVYVQKVEKNEHVEPIVQKVDNIEVYVQKLDKIEHVEPIFIEETLNYSISELVDFILKKKHNDISQIINSIDYNIKTNVANNDILSIVNSLVGKEEIKVDNEVGKILLSLHNKLVDVIEENVHDLKAENKKAITSIPKKAKVYKKIKYNGIENILKSLQNKRYYSDNGILELLQTLNRLPIINLGIVEEEKKKDNINPIKKLRGKKAITSKKENKEKLNINSNVSCITVQQATIKHSDIKLGESNNNGLNDKHILPKENIRERYTRLSQNPFELRYKGLKIFDSYIKKNVVIFNETNVAVGTKKYPYSGINLKNI